MFIVIYYCWSDVGILQEVLALRYMVIIKNNDLREAVVTDTFLFLSTFFIQSAALRLLLNSAYVNNIFN